MLAGRPVSLLVLLFNMLLNDIYCLSAAHDAIAFDLC